MLVFGADTYDEGFEPKPPVPFPTEYKNYQILPGSFSPDNKYGLIYPKRSLLFEEARDGSLSLTGDLYLAALNPFQILSEIPLGNSTLSASSRGSYEVDWAKDSSAVLMIESIKWGPDKVFLVPLHNGKAGKITDLTAEVRKQVQSDYDKSHAPRYNEYFDFIFDSDYPDRWRVNERGQVEIQCTCTTDPKESETNAWTMKFEGLWDRAKGKFIRKKLQRIVRTPLDE